MCTGALVHFSLDLLNHGSCGCGGTEIVDFTRYMQPSREEQAMREAAVGRVRAVAMSIWPNGEMAVFGSYATGQ